MTENYEQVTRVMFEEVIAGGRFDRLAEVVTEDAVDHGPMGDVVGIDALRESFVPYRQAMPDLRLEVSQFTAVSDDLVICVVHSTGTFTGKLLGILGTGRELDLWVPNALRFRDGKIAEHWGFGLESFTLFSAQLGIELPSPT